MVTKDWSAMGAGMKPRWKFNLGRKELKRLHDLAAGRDGQTANRARVILWAVDGMSNAEIARLLGFSLGTVRVYHTKFRQNGMDFIEPKAQWVHPSPKADAIRSAAQRLWNGGGSERKLLRLRDICVEVRAAHGLDVSENWASVVLRSKKRKRQILVSSSASHPEKSAGSGRDESVIKTAYEAKEISRRKQGGFAVSRRV